MLRSLSKFHFTWIALGWFVAASVTSLVLLGLAGLGVLPDEPSAGDIWVLVSFVVGFWLAGFFIGTRSDASPVLYGLGIGLFSLVVWVLVNLFLGEPTRQTAWTGMSTRTAAALLILQTFSAVIGARIGARFSGS